MMKIINKLLSGWHTASPGVKASIAVFFANLVTKGISYLTSPIFTRILSTEEYGRVSVFFTWVQILGIVAMFSLSMGVFNVGMSDYPTKRDEYSFSMLVLSNIITVVFSAVLILLYPVLKNWLHMDFSLVILMCLIFLLQPAYNFWYQRQRFELKYKAVVFWAITSAFFSPLIAIILVLRINNVDHANLRIFGTEIPLLLMYIGFYLLLASRSRFSINRKYWRAAFIFNLPLIPHYLSTYMLSSADRIMISHIVSDSATAYYSVANAVASIALVIWSAINGSLTPYVYEKCKTKDYKSIAKVANPLIAAFGIACVLVIMLAPEVVQIMATKGYMEAIYVIPPIVGGVFFQVQYHLYANVMYYYKKPKYVMIGSVSATILNIGLNYIFISKYGFLAAGYTTLFCYMLQAIVDFVAMKKTIGDNVYDIRFISILSSIIIVIALLSNLVYDLMIIRYFIVISLFIFTFFFREKLFPNLKRE